METITYDAVFVCSGNYFKPNIPQFPGMEKFKGTQLHSHDYRRAQDYQGKMVFNFFVFLRCVILFKTV